MAKLALCLALVALLSCAAVAKVNVNLTDKLVDLIKKKTLEPFVEELQREDMDVNQPDSKGRLPLIEAVRTKEVKLVDALLQYGALAKSKDPATGASPLHVAFQQNLPQIARMLLQYGADINVEDKAGKKAREFAPSKDIRDLIVAYDADGAMAFEDAPGTWTKQNKDAKEDYWFNSKTGESRWNLPPSCAWQRVDSQGHPIKYVNAVTGQEVATVPPSLAWSKLRAEGKEIWYNWRLNVSQFEKPQEVPAAMMAEIEKNMNVRWHNEKTGEFSWIDPAYRTPWRELHDDEHKKPYWFNVETGESVWDMPEAMAWTKVKDDGSGQHYFFNRLTSDSTWEAPQHLAWVRHDSDL
ncbi:hypothetical protein HYH02_013118 [Chlamydomonas schloesseri]|uniref:WW domain-containing protein n=1 Tax=Chlamydomonas schloesseri TaxID=2026947 RepID=A0A835SY03_9CHLO|nr:hypothetical protein HYH02_013118 [Chlamydomonas schloesseri]|eukprot:KAG2432048.1 hypothetical protein HYH02_013118 [Chlamydomonas schloesseri]